MILDAESWIKIRRFRALHEASASYAEIGQECGCDWRTVKKYLAEDGVALPPGNVPVGTQPRMIEAFVGVVDSLLRGDITVQESVIHERLVAEYGFRGHYQRVKTYVAEARPRIATEVDGADENRLTGLHRRFETVPGRPRSTGGRRARCSHVGIPTVRCTRRPPRSPSTTGSRSTRWPPTGRPEKGLYAAKRGRRPLIRVG